jgi:hypothetical protein
MTTYQYNWSGVNSLMLQNQIMSSTLAKLTFFPPVVAGVPLTMSFTTVADLLANEKADLDQAMLNFGWAFAAQF